jgi:hypothetical protein
VGVEQCVDVGAGVGIEAACERGSGLDSDTEKQEGAV